MARWDAHAVVVGIAGYRDTRGNLPEAVRNDARDVHALLVSPERCGYPPEHVGEPLLDERADKAGILAGLGRLAGQAGPDSTAFFFFSGHGDRIDGGEYLLPHDLDTSSPEAARRSAISTDEFSSPDGFRYDASVAFADADFDWVYDQLVPRLERRGLTFTVSADNITAAKAVAAQEAIEQSRYVLLILSPGYTQDGWLQHTAVLGIHHNIETGSRKVIPVKIAEPRQEVLMSVKALVGVDLTQPGRRFDMGMERLLKTLTAGQGTVILWDVSGRRNLGEPLKGHEGFPVTSVAFSPDGKTLASSGLNGTVTLWDTDVDSWTRRAGRIANRNLSRPEWEQYMGRDVPYHKTFEDLPPGEGAIVGVAPRDQ
jgi:hypothetical protein